MTPSPSFFRTSLFFKLIECLLVGFYASMLRLLFLAWVDGDRLKAAFWDVVDRLPTIRLGRNLVKSGVRLLPFVAAVSVIQSFKAGYPHDTALLGIWKVERFVRNGHLLPATPGTECISSAGREPVPL